VVELVEKFIETSTFLSLYSLTSHSSHQTKLISPIYLFTNMVFILEKPQRMLEDLPLPRNEIKAMSYFYNKWILKHYNNKVLAFS